MNIFITGGAGFIGSVLARELILAGYAVTVYDALIFGREPLIPIIGHPGFTLVHADIRDHDTLRHALNGQEIVIHLACISNDPSFELDPTLGADVNYNCFLPLVRYAKEAGVQRFIYASTSAVYGIQDAPAVTEDLTPAPLTPYATCKLLCESLLLHAREPGFEVAIFRPATVCGVSPRQRLDLVVNTLTAQAVVNRHITVKGGDQFRASIHIDDMVELYVRAVRAPAEIIDGEIFNVGYANNKVLHLASKIARVCGLDAAKDIEIAPSNDERSYRVSSKKMDEKFHFRPMLPVEKAVLDLAKAIRGGAIPNPMTCANYYNISRMQQVLAQGHEIINPLPRSAAQWPPSRSISRPRRRPNPRR